MIFSNSFASPRPIVAATLALSTIFGVAVLSGCGGNNKTVTANSATPATRVTGDTSFSVKWPARDAATRLVPVASNSIRVRVTNPGDATVLGEVILARPAGNAAVVTTGTLRALPVGTLSATAIAYPNTDGTGVAQASASASVTVRVGTNAPLALTMGSTIASVEIAPSLLELEPGDEFEVSITAKDAAGNTVLTGSALRWATGSVTTARVTVDPATPSIATVRGLVNGATQLSVTEVESGKTATIPLTVVAVSTRNFLNLQTNDLAYDPFAGKVYASIPSTEFSINGNSIVAIDPEKLTVGQPIFVGSEPDSLEITQNAFAEGGTLDQPGRDPDTPPGSPTAKYAFVALGGEAAVVRVNLRTGKQDAKFSVLDDDNIAYPIESIALSPDEGRSVVVARQNPGGGQRARKAVVYQRDLSVPDSETADPVIDPDPTDDTVLVGDYTTKYRLVGVTTEGVVNLVRFDTRTNNFTGFNIERVEADVPSLTPFTFGNNPTPYTPPGGGVTAGVFTLSLLRATNVDVRFGGTKGFSGDGLVFQVEPTGTSPVVGAIATLAIGDLSAPFAVDNGLGRIWYITGGDTGSLTIKAFDTNSYLPVARVTIPNVSGLPIRVIRWGATGLAISTSGGQVYFIKRAPGLPVQGSGAGGI